MSAAAIEIVPCPAVLGREALALVLQEIAPEQRLLIAPPLGGDSGMTSVAVEGLWIARCGEELCGAAWGQRQPGNTAIFWPPQTLDGAETNTAVRLSQAVVASLDAASVGLTQVLLPDRESVVIRTLESVGFRYLADLLYLNWEASAQAGLRQPQTSSERAGPLQFEPFAESQRPRLSRLVERTYEGTQDCAAMNGKRSIDDVIDGYRATGDFRPENWLFVRNEQQDVGVLLLAEHADARHFELVYMGLLPAARGHGWGLFVAQYAQWLAIRAGVERLVLAVDAANLPALAMYRDAGFAAWDRRSVFVRFGEA